MTENNQSASDNKPKRISWGYWIGFLACLGLSVLSFSIGFWLLAYITVPLTGGCLAGGIFFALFPRKRFVSVLAFIGVIILLFVLIVAGGGFAY